jgi:hypothetical protein
MMGGAGFFAIGITQFDLVDLNSTLSDAGYGEFGHNFLSTGGGGYGILKNWVIGGEGFYFTRQTVTDSNRTASINGSTGMFRLGYVILSKKGFYLYPMAGVGGGVFEMQLKQSDSIPSFPAVATQPGRSAHLEANGLILDAGLGISFTPKGGVTGSGGPTFGIRAGYVFSPSDFTWKMDKDNLTGGPSVGMNGLYVRLTIGGGGFGRM